MAFFLGINSKVAKKRKIKNIFLGKANKYYIFFYYIYGNKIIKNIKIMNLYIFKIV